MRECTIIKAPSSGTIPAIPSKSAAHRLIIAACLSGVPGDSFSKRLTGLSEDITATLECMEALMSSIKDGNEARTMNCRESGSTLRFLIPVCATFGGENLFKASGRLPDRPLTPLKHQLEAHGCTMSSQGDNPIWIKGKLSSGKYTLPGDVSSQYVTGLLMALPLCEGDSTIEIEGPLQSRPYVDMTLDVLSIAKIKITELGNTFHIQGGQDYKLPPDALNSIEGDWSNGAFWHVMNAISDGDIRCIGLDPHSHQGDKAITDWLHIPHVDGEITIDVGNIPDLVPVLSVLASSRKVGAATNIVNAGRLRIKESDRLRAVTQVINGLGGNIRELPDGLVIEGVERLKGGTADSFNDHRIAMMAATAACISNNPITIKGCDAVNKSYPGFFEDYCKLGGILK